MLTSQVPAPTLTPKSPRLGRSLYWTHYHLHAGSDDSEGSGWRERISIANESHFKIVIVTVRNTSSADCESGTLCISRAAPQPSTSAATLYRDPLGKADMGPGYSDFVRKGGIYFARDGADNMPPGTVKYGNSWGTSFRIKRKDQSSPLGMKKISIPH